MSIAARLRDKFAAAGFEVSGAGDVSLAAFAWYAGKAAKTIRNTLHAPGKWPRSHSVGGARRFTIDAIVEWELRKIDEPTNGIPEYPESQDRAA